MRPQAWGPAASAARAGGGEPGRASQSSARAPLRTPFPLEAPPPRPTPLTATSVGRVERVVRGPEEAGQAAFTIDAAGMMLGQDGAAECRDPPTPPPPPQPWVCRPRGGGSPPPQSPRPALAAATGWPGPVPPGSRCTRPRPGRRCPGSGWRCAGPPRGRRSSRGRGRGNCRLERRGHSYSQAPHDPASQTTGDPRCGLVWVTAHTTWPEHASGHGKAG